MQIAEMDLTDNFNDNLIELVRARTCLYNKQNKRYHDNNFKTAAWLQIANKLNRIPEECKTRWKHLRETFVRKKNKRKLRGSGTKADTWPYFQSMSFLTAYLHPRRSTIRYKRTSRKDSVQPSDDDFLEVQEEETSPNNSEREHSVYSPILESSPSKHNRTGESILKTEDIVQYFNTRPHQDSTNNNDHIYSFFKAMADSVVNLPTELQLNVKQQVFSIVSEAEYENIRPKPSAASKKRTTQARSTPQQQDADTSNKYNILCESIPADECIEKEDDCV